jgi:hypothetical protein
MLCKKNYKVVIIMRFLLHEIIVPKMFMVDAFLNTEHSLIRAVKTNTYYVIFFMKGSNYSHKLRYKGYLQLIYR